MKKGGFSMRQLSRTDGQTNGWTDGRTDGRTNEQTYFFLPFPKTKPLVPRSNNFYYRQDSEHKSLFLNTNFNIERKKVRITSVILEQIPLHFIIIGYKNCCSLFP